MPAGVNVKAPVRLRYWPNFTRLLLTPHAMRISALWAEAPRSLLETARMLGIDQRFVFAFFSAAVESGYVDLPTVKPVRDTEEHPAGKVVHAHKRRGLLGRILQHLGAV